MIADAYRNLARSCWSIRYRGKVVARVPCATITNAKFKVSESGRQRVLRERRKNVHAVIRGTIATEQTPVPATAVRIRYNPYKAPTFTTDDGSPVTHADTVWLCDDGTAYATLYTP